MPQFSDHGTREGVLKKLESWPSEKEMNGTDKGQIESFKSHLISDINAIGTNGVRVISECFTSGLVRSSSITVIAQEISV